MRGLLVLSVAFSLLGTLNLVVSARAEVEPVIIAVIDTGIRPTHDAFTPGQIVAWYDFTDHTPRSNQTTWDPRVTKPYDPVGHGTAVASMAAGDLEGLTPNFAPGFSLAIARVTGDPVEHARALLWAVDVVGADVVVRASGPVAPMPPLLWRDAHLLATIDYARSRGVLLVAAAGNGVANTGAPSTSWGELNGNSALVVGGARGPDKGSETCLVLECVDIQRLEGEPTPYSYDPEVTSDFYVDAACKANDSCITRIGGTSFASPRAGSLAAALLAHARAQGVTLSVDDLEWTIKKSATGHSITYTGIDVEGIGGDEPGCWRLPFTITFCRPGVPPVGSIETTPLLASVPVSFPAVMSEGYGYLAADSLARGKAIIDGAPGPSGEDWETRVFYVETYRATMVDAWGSIPRPCTQVGPFSVVSASCPPR